MDMDIDMDMDMDMDVGCRMQDQIRSDQIRCRLWMVSCMLCYGWMGWGVDGRL